MRDGVAGRKRPIQAGNSGCNCWIGMGGVSDRLLLRTGVFLENLNNKQWVND